MLENKNSFLQIIMRTRYKHYHKHHLKILLYVLYYTSLSSFCPSLKLFQHTNTSRLYISKTARPNWNRFAEQNSWCWGLGPPTPHTYIKGFAGTSSNWAPGWTLSRERSILTPPCPPRSPAMLPQTILQQNPRLSNREQSGGSIQKHTRSCSKLKY